MPQYKLTYFPARAKAELSRLVFAAAGEKYEDDRITADAFSQLKPDLPFGQVPVLSVDGRVLCQSNTIARYLANEFELAGKNNWEQAQADMIVDCCEDTLNPLQGIFAVKDDKEKKNQIVNSFEKEKLPGFITNLEKMLKKNSGGDRFFVGENLTWADLAVLNLYDYLTCRMYGVNVLLDDYPKIKAHRARVLANPKVAEYLANRPDTDI